MGWISLTASDGPATSSVTGADTVAAAGSEDGSYRLENSSLLVEIGNDGTIHRVFDKASNREALTDRGNQLWAYVDKPYDFDAWDVDETYERDGEEMAGVQSITVVDVGPLRGSVRVSRKWRETSIVQTYQLLANSNRIDIKTEINWHQRQVLLKARFPLAVHAHEATFETMFGTVTRPTHRSSPLDAAKFEVCGHRFADLSEPGYGVALLNDSKYGHDVNQNVLSLTLLRGPLYPDPFADEGHHAFTYSLLPHARSLSESDVVAEAFELNSPLVVVGTSESSGTVSFVQTRGIPVALGALKIAEDSNDLILRLYEPHGRRGQVELEFADEMASVEFTNLLEDHVSDGEGLFIQDGNRVAIDFSPFEMKSLRLRPNSGEEVA